MIIKTMKIKINQASPGLDMIINIMKIKIIKQV